MQLRLEQLEAQHRGSELLLARDDLQQDAAGDVLAALVVDHLDALAARDELAQVVERDVPALLGVVEAPVGVFAYQALFGHVYRSFSRPRTVFGTERVASVYAAHNDGLHASGSDSR